MSELVSVTRDGDVGVTTINNPPVNALSQAVLREIRAALDKLGKDAGVKAVVLTGGGRLFSGGADITEFGEMAAGRRTINEFPLLLDALDAFTKPVVCAIHGTAFGGGLETALACHYRVAVPGAQVGQPEVKLGIIPGAGGTQRLPRLTGLAKAAEMCAGGDPVSAPDALAAGILDKLIDGDLVPGAVAFAREMAAKGGPPRRTRDLTDRLGDPSALTPIRDAVKKKARGLLAPMKAVDA